MGEFVRMDDRRRVTLPPEMAELFSEGIIRVRKEKNRVVLESVKDPFKELHGSLSADKPFLELRRELERKLESGELEL